MRTPASLAVCVTALFTEHLLAPSLVLAQAPSAVVAGTYECWAHGRPRMLMNFKVTGAKNYANPDGSKKGTFAYTPATGVVVFKGGHLDGVMPPGFTVVYHEPHKKPTVSFRGPSGEAQFCERVNR